MHDEATKALDARYARRFGWAKGYLPKNRDAVDEWQRDLKKQLEKTRAEGRSLRKRGGAVESLAKLIEANGIVRMYVEQMIAEVPPEHRTIESVPEMLEALDHIVTTAPLYNPDPKKRNAFPMSSLFVYMMMTPAGEAAFRNDLFNAGLKNVLTEWCAFLDSDKSQYVLNTGETGWLSPSAYDFNKLYEFVIPDQKAPHWGFASYNAYFHRQIKAECRPIADPMNPKVIVSANDGTVYAIARGVKELDRFWIKGQPYSLANMLAGSQYLERFVGGDVFQSFLSGADYHRWRSPIDGVIRDARVVDGLMFSDAESAGDDPTAGTYSQGYEASVNTRGLVFVESDDPKIGMVSVIPIGITEISSVTISAKVGTHVKKGDELGYFSYGGSSMCLVFQRRAIDRFTVSSPPPGGNPDDGPPIKVNAEIAVAR